MSSLLNRFKSSAGTSNSRSQGAKKDPNAPQPTPLEKLIADVGPLRQDGSDKFWGMENFGSTCYCNSIIQCLYHSPPFREQILNFPFRSIPFGAAYSDPNSSDTSQNGHLAPNNSRLSGGPASPGARLKPATTGATSPPLPNREDSKDSSEYKKKLALANGPLIALDTANGERYGMENESLFVCLKEIFESMVVHESRTGVISPQKFLEILRRDHDVFRAPMHQDAHEFLNLLLNQIIENVEQYSKDLEMRNQGEAIVESDESDKTESSSGSSTSESAVMIRSKEGTRSKLNGPNTKWVHELFEGTLTSETRCLACENTSSRDEAFLDLSVDLDQSSSVTACLLKFSEEEMLCEKNKFHCDKCGGLQEAEKRMKIKSLPKILALHLKRFKYTEDLQRLQKLFHHVPFPFFLRLLNTTDDASESDRLYELYGVVVHIGGGPYHGHYVSIIKTQDRGWLLFDDENVEPVDRSFVWEFFGGDQSLACAYVLFYQETTAEAMTREQEAVDGITNMWAADPATSVNGKYEGFSPPAVPAPTTPQIEDNEFPKFERPIMIPLTASPGTVGTSSTLSPNPKSPNPGISLSKNRSGPFSRKEKDINDKEERLSRGVDTYTGTTDAGYGIGLGLAEDYEAALQQQQQQQQATMPQQPGFFSGGLNRFRQTSKSIKKQKIWGSGKSKTEMQQSPESSSTNMSLPLQVQQSLEGHGLLAPALQMPPMPQMAQQQPSFQQSYDRPPPTEYAPPKMSIAQLALSHAPSGDMVGQRVPSNVPSAPESNMSSSRRLSLTSSAVLGGGILAPRTPSPSGVATGDFATTTPSKKKEKEKRGMFGFGKRKSGNASGGF